MRQAEGSERTIRHFPALLQLQTGEVVGGGKAAVSLTDIKGSFSIQKGKITGGLVQEGDHGIGRQMQGQIP